MTTAIALIWPDTGDCSLRVKGHATGSDKVCAAISSLIWALVGYLTNDDAVHMEVLRTDPADAEIQWRGGDEGTMAAFRTACIGLLQIEQAEPNYLKTKISQNIFPK